MKIKRRKKNERFAFFHMSPLLYWKYRLSINPERRLDKTLPPETKQARDRSRAAKFRELYSEGPGLPISEIIHSFAHEPAHPL